MGQKLTWFVLGAVVASAVWLTVLASIDAQLLSTFLGVQRQLATCNDNSGGAHRGLRRFPIPIR